MITVVNVTGSGADRAADICGCPSWNVHWRRHSGSGRRTCMAVGCRNDAKHGGHVRRHPTGRTEYIVGLCPTCNHPSNTEPFEIDDRNAHIQPVYQVGCGVLNELEARDVIRLTPTHAETYELIEKDGTRGPDFVDWVAWKQSNGKKTTIRLHGEHVRYAGR